MLRADSRWVNAHRLIPMIFNVAALLNGHTGEMIKFHFAHETLRYEAMNFIEVEAQGKLMRTDRTVLAQADVKALAESQCARCLKHADIKLDLNFAEEFLPTSIDLIARRHIWHDDAYQDTDEALTISESNILDMSVALSQSLAASMPMMPLCRNNCKGLCQQCSQNLNIATCECPEVMTNSTSLSKIIFT